ncbi:hypothetical protein E4T56_gene289 [Termitomyces sp. T112]|nr:hypothetical protein E4T56_gene289 [Termitomyces sp. T112]
MLKTYFQTLEGLWRYSLVKGRRKMRIEESSPYSHTLRGYANKTIFRQLTLGVVEHQFLLENIFSDVDLICVYS